MRREDVSIVLVGDDAEVLAALKEHLQDQHFSAAVARGPKQARQMMWQMQPQVLFACFEQVSEAREVVVALRQALPREALQRNHAFVGCDAEHVDEAVQNVLSGQFEDYVVTKPFLDPHCLPVMIHHAMRFDDMREALRCCKRRLHASGEQARDHVAACDTIRHRNEQANAKTEHDYDQLGLDVEGVMAKALQEAGLPSNGESDPGSPDEIAARAGKRLEDLLDGFGQQLRSNLASWAREAEKQHAKLSSLAENIESDTRPGGYVMIVDDNPLDRKTMTKWVEQEGYTARAVDSAYAALKSAQEERPALVLMDLYMPGMDGAVATRKLRGLPGLKQLPVVMVSASKSKDSIKKAVDARVSSYLCKPLSREVLVGKIAGFLGAET